MLGYIVTSLKDVSDINVGDTISLKKEKEVATITWLQRGKTNGI